MPIFNIVEVDRDYNAVTDQKRMEFASQEDADRYCKDKTWSGYRYSAFAEERRKKLTGTQEIAVRRFLSGQTDEDYPPI